MSNSHDISNAKNLGIIITVLLVVRFHPRVNKIDTIYHHTEIFGW